MEIVLSLVIFSLSMAAIGIGLLFRRGPPSGSCGGLASLGLKRSCELCSGRDSCPKHHRKIITEPR